VAPLACAHLQRHPSINTTGAHASLINVSCSVQHALVVRAQQAEHKTVTPSSLVCKAQARLEKLRLQGTPTHVRQCCNAAAQAPPDECMAGLHYEARRRRMASCEWAGLPCMDLHRGHEPRCRLQYSHAEVLATKVPRRQVRPRLKYLCS
jgi:hypothetical protein